MTDKCTDGQEHDKCYSSEVLCSNPPQYPWICRECGAEGVDRGTYHCDEYGALKRRKERPLTTPMHRLAEKIFYSRIRSITSTDIPPAGYEYRDGKGLQDVKRAFRDGMQEGAGKFECEMDRVARRLEQVFRKTVGVATAQSGGG